MSLFLPNLPSVNSPHPILLLEPVAPFRPGLDLRVTPSTSHSPSAPRHNTDFQTY